MNSLVKLKWYAWTTTTFVFLVVLWFLGFYDLLLASDATYLGFTTIALYVLSSLFIGLNLDKGIDLAFFDFVAGRFLTLGFLGTLIGLIIAFFGFGHLDISNVAAMQPIVIAVAYGMATALYTTLVGLVCAEFLQIQLVILSAGYEEEAAQ